MPTPSTELEAKLSSAYLPIYYGAFHPYQLTVGLTLAAALIWLQSTPIVHALYALLLSPFVWAGTVWYVNRTYREKLDTFNQDAIAIGKDIFGTVGTDSVSFSIEHSYGSVWFVKPNMIYSPVSIIVGESSVLVYDDSKLKLDRLQADFGDSTREFFYDSITSINYDSPHFEIRLNDGEQAQYRSSRKPDDVLHELQNRVREYRAQT